MSRNKFVLLNKFFHVSDNNDPTNKDDPLRKIRNFVNICNNNFKVSFKPSENLTVDEAMVKFKGSLKFCNL
jgi:hypothetical protein